MGKFAETAILDYRLSFADHGKQTSFSVSVCSKQTEVNRFRLQQTRLTKNGVLTGW
jgi:hypothetical protein